MNDIITKEEIVQFFEKNYWNDNNTNLILGAASLLQNGVELSFIDSID